MDVRDLFLEQHTAMHTAAVGGNKMSMAVGEAATVRAAGGFGTGV